MTQWRPRRVKSNRKRKKKNKLVMTRKVITSITSRCRGARTSYRETRERPSAEQKTVCESQMSPQQTTDWSPAQKKKRQLSLLLNFKQQQMVANDVTGKKTFFFFFLEKEKRKYRLISPKKKKRTRLKFHLKRTNVQPRKVWAAIDFIFTCKIWATSLTFSFLFSFTPPLPLALLSSITFSSSSFFYPHTYSRAHTQAGRAAKQMQLTFCASEA